MNDWPVLFQSFISYSFHQYIIIISRFAIHEHDEPLAQAHLQPKLCIGYKRFKSNPRVYIDSGSATLKKIPQRLTIFLLVEFNQCKIGIYALRMFIMIYVILKDVDSAEGIENG